MGGACAHVYARTVCVSCLHALAWVVVPFALGDKIRATSVHDMGADRGGAASCQKREP